MQKVITFCLSESCIQRKVGIEDNDMKIINKDIDSGKPFDWGKTSFDYAKFRRSEERRVGKEC